MSTPRTLKAMQNRPTSYEVVLKTRETRKRLGFSQCKTLRALQQFCGNNCDEISALMTESELDMDWKHKDGVLSFAGGKVQVLFSGRTERDIASELGMVQ